MRYSTGSRKLIFGEAMSILARSTFSPSLNSPAFIRANRSRFSSTRAVALRAFWPGSVRVPRVSRICVGRLSRRHKPALCESAARRARTFLRNNRRRRTSRPIQSRASCTSRLMDSTYSVSSLSGFVSSNRRFVRPSNSSASVEVETDRFGVPDMQIAVRLRRKAGDDFLHAAALQIFAHDIFNEIEMMSCSFPRDSTFLCLIMILSIHHTQKAALL